VVGPLAGLEQIAGHPQRPRAAGHRARARQDRVL